MYPKPGFGVLRSCPASFVTDRACMLWTKFRAVLRLFCPADGSTEDVGARLEDIQARKSVCARDQQHMYPLGDGRGGLLTRRRWQGGSQRPQLVQHIGGCNYPCRTSTLSRHFTGRLTVFVMIFIFNSKNKYRVGWLEGLTYCSTQSTLTQ